MEKTNISSSNLISVFIQALDDYTSTTLPTGTAIRNQQEVEVTFSFSSTGKTATYL
jgi:hypothetical protein